MISKTTDLIVPVRDRRQHVRIITLKNFRRALLLLVVLFAGIETTSRLHRDPGGDFGRLLDGEMNHPPVVASRAPAVVHEGEIPDAESADPYLTAPAVRAQYLGTATPNQPAVELVQNPTATTAAAAVNPQQPGSMWIDETPNRSSKDGGVAIVGGQDGVSIRATSSSRMPKLSGGIFR